MNHKVGKVSDTISFLDKKKSKTKESFFSFSIDQKQSQGENEKALISLTSTITGKQTILF